jgi:hypothetical protein
MSLSRIFRQLSRSRPGWELGLLGLLHRPATQRFCGKGSARDTRRMSQPFAFHRGTTMKHRAMS